MSNMLDKYKDSTDETSAPFNDNEAVEVSSSKAKRLHYYKERELRLLKRLTKALRKRNKLMEQEAARRKAEEEAAAEKAAAEKATKRKGEATKGFLGKLGDAICKAIPALATMVVGFFLRRAFPVKAPQAA